MANAYMAVCNVPPHTHTLLQKCIVIVHEVVFNFKIGWEPTAVNADWCDARLFSTPKMNLTLKGVPFCNAAMLARTLGDRWPDPRSPNCPTVLGSMIAALVGKGLTLADNRLAVNHNVQTIVQGCGYKQQQWWWWQPIRNRPEAQGPLPACVQMVVLGNITTVWKPLIVHTIAKSLGENRVT